MQTHYNTLAGSEVGRIAALSDGLFAIAATILVLDFHTPEPTDIHSEADLLRALATSAPRLLPCLLSLLTLGIFWLGQQTQLSQLERSNRVSDRFSCLLDQYPPPRRVSLRHMGVRRAGEPHSR